MTTQLSPPARQYFYHSVLLLIASETKTRDGELTEYRLEIVYPLDLTTSEIDGKRLVEPDLPSISTLRS
jgi:hypothetical protein